MDETTSAVASQADGGDEASSSSQVDETTTKPQEGESQKAARSAEDYERMIADLRKENAKHRTSLKKFEDDARQREEASLSKEQLLEKELSTLKAEREEAAQAQFERSVRSDVAIEAAKLGVDPNYLDMVSRMLDWEEIDVDETGAPSNLAELVKGLVAKMPALKSRGSSTASAGGATNPSRSVSGAVQVTEQFVRDVLSGKLPQDTYTKLSPEQRHQFLQTQAAMSRR